MRDNGARARSSVHSYFPLHLPYYPDTAVGLLLLLLLAPQVLEYLESIVFCTYRAACTQYLRNVQSARYSIAFENITVYTALSYFKINLLIILDTWSYHFIFKNYNLYVYIWTTQLFKIRKQAIKGKFMGGIAVPNDGDEFKYSNMW